jgi:hypothetical protein
MNHNNDLNIPVGVMKQLTDSLEQTQKLAKEFFGSYVSVRFITVFTKVHHWSS